MKAEKIVINSSPRMSKVIRYLWTLWKQHKYFVLSISFARDRTLTQNALWFAMYKRIAETLGCEIQYARAYCKLRFGVPILMGENERFVEIWGLYVLPNPKLNSWKAQMDMMADSGLGSDGYPVTRWMTTKQGAEYTDTIVRYFAPKGVFFGDLLDEK